MAAYCTRIILYAYEWEFAQIQHKTQHNSGSGTRLLMLVWWSLTRLSVAALKQKLVPAILWDLLNYFETISFHHVRVHLTTRFCSFCRLPRLSLWKAVNATEHRYHAIPCHVPVILHEVWWVLHVLLLIYSYIQLVTRHVIYALQGWFKGVEISKQTKNKVKTRSGEQQHAIHCGEIMWNQWLRPMKTYVHLTDQCAWVYVSCCATPVCRDWQASPKELLGCDLRNPATLRVGMHVEFQLGELLMRDGLWDEGVFKSPWQGYIYVSLNSLWSTENMCKQAQIPVLVQIQRGNKFK